MFQQLSGVTQTCATKILGMVRGKIRHFLTAVLQADEARSLTVWNVTVGGVVGAPQAALWGRDLRPGIVLGIF